MKSKILIAAFISVFSLQSYSAVPQRLFDEWKKTAFDRDKPMQERWKALMSFGQAGKEKSIAELLKASRSSDWLLRSGSIMALKNIDKGKAIELAQKLLSDRAMMVRVGAAKALAQMNATSAVPSLWKEFNHARNFSRGQSLPSRFIILQTLWQLSNDKAAWEKLLTDKDAEVRQIASNKLQEIY